MEKKQQKLSLQADKPTSNLLKSLILYVDGYLPNTTFIDFKQLVFQNGGQVYEHYTGRITHIIATQVSLLIDDGFQNDQNDEANCKARMDL